MHKFFICLFAASLLCSCGTSNKREGQPLSIFKYNEMAGVSSVDPAAARSFENIWVVNQLYDGLVQMNDLLKVEPSIASSWKISENGKTYTFHLNPSVYFHDDKCFSDGKGRKVVASDFVYSFERLLDPRVSSATSLLLNVDRDYNNGFEAPNDSTFIIHLQKPFTPFISVLTMKYFSVIPKEAIELYGDDFRRNPVGTGPFKFQLWNEGSKMLLVKNEKYFEYDNGTRLPYLDVVSITFIKDMETSFFNFLQGDVDMVSGIDAINTDEVFTVDGKLKEEYKERFVMQTQPYLKTDYLGFLIDQNLLGLKDSPSKNKALRKAIAYGFDREKMVTYLRNNLGVPATAGFIPPGLPSFDEKIVEGYDYNPEKVKELLFMAGFPDGESLPEITLSSTEQYIELAEYIQSQLSEFGFKINIDIQKPSVLSDAVANSSIHFFRKSWVADYADEENFFSLFYSKNWSPKGFNYTHYSNPQFDLMYEQSQEEPNDSIRYDLYRKMDMALMEDLPVIPIYYDQVVRLVQKNVEGLTSNPMNMLNLKRVKK